MKSVSWTALLSICMLLGCAGKPGSATSPALIDSRIAERLHGIEWELKSLTVDGSRVIMHPDAPMAITFAPVTNAGADGE